MLSLVIPTYNVANTLPILVQKTVEVLWREKIDVELICIDDASTDNTLPQLHYLSGLYKNLRYSFHRKHLGRYLTMIEGIATAQGVVIGVMDSSLSHAPEYLPHMLKPVFSAEVEIALGSKFASGAIFQGGYFAEIVQRFWAKRARHLVPLRDPLSNFFVFRRDVMQNIPFSQQGLSVGLELFVKGRYTSILETGYHYIHLPSSLESIRIQDTQTLLSQFRSLWRWKKQNVPQ